MGYDTSCFHYREVLNSRRLNTLPNFLKLDNPSKEIILFRILIGSIDIQRKYDQKVVSVRKNYSRIGISNVIRVSKRTIFDNQLGIEGNEELADRYFARNRQNTSLFSSILFEISNFVFQRECGAHIAAFVHLYRCYEYIAYSFPMLYAAKSTNYKGSYNALKNFFGNSESELKFFKNFQETLVENQYLELSVTLDFESPTFEMTDEFNKILLELFGENIFDDINETILNTKYKYIFDMVIMLLTA
jgi:hypothetical protein